MLQVPKILKYTLLKEENETTAVYVDKDRNEGSWNVLRCYQRCYLICMRNFCKRYYRNRKNFVFLLGA